jgi:hypothetical protein
MTINIVKFTNNIHDTEVDAYAELFKNKNKVPVLTVRTRKDKTDEKNQTLLYKFITNNFPVTFDNNTYRCIINYPDPNSSNFYSSIISFDSNSSSAYTDFKKILTDYCNSKYTTKYYANGRELYVGEVVENSNDTLAHGQGTIYYNTLGHKIKYLGEFEEGHADGAGIYYNADGNIFLKANNISSGIPTQKGFLHINFTNKKEVIEIEFNQLWENLKLYDKNAKINFVISDIFVNSIAKYYWNKQEIPLDVFIFQDRPAREQFIDLWYKLNFHEQKMDAIYKYNTFLDKKLDNIAWRIVILFLLVLINTFYLIYQSLDYEY